MKSELYRSRRENNSPGRGWYDGRAMTDKAEVASLFHTDAYTYIRQLVVDKQAKLSAIPVTCQSYMDLKTTSKVL